MIEKIKNILLIVFVALFLVAVLTAYSFYNELSQLKEDPQKVVQEQTTALLTKIAKLIALPEGEAPTIATVSDPEKLKSQPFFARAKRGDKVLIYTNARRAILYCVKSPGRFRVRKRSRRPQAGAVRFRSQSTTALQLMCV